MPMILKSLSFFIAFIISCSMIAQPEYDGEKGNIAPPEMEQQNDSKLSAREENSGDNLSQIKTYLEMAEAYRNRDSEKAVNYAMEAFKLSQVSGIVNYEAKAAYKLGFSYYSMNRYDQAIEYLQKALEIYQKINDQEGAALSYNRLGNAYQLKGNYEQALENYQTALSLNKESRNKKELARTYSNLGTIYRIYGKFEEAIDYSLNALSTYEEVGFKDGMAWTLLNIGRLYKQLEGYDRALENVRRSLSIYREIESETGNKTGITLSHKELSSIYFEMKNYDQALMYNEKVLEINKTTGNEHGVANSIASMGKIYYDMGRYEASLNHLFEALKIKKQLNDSTDLASIYLFIGRSYNKLNDASKALEYLNKSLAIARSQNLRTELKDAFHTLYEIYRDKNDYQKALEYHLWYARLKDSINIKNITRLEMQYEFDKTQQKLEMEREKQEAIHRAELQRQKIIRNSFVAGFLLMVLLAFLIFRNYRQKKRANKALKEKNEEINQQKEEIETQRDEIEVQKDYVTRQRDQIAKQNKVIKDSIQYAQRIQSAVLPQEKEITDYLPEHFILFRPRDIVSGDFYWLNKQNGRIILAVADCTGHGVPGAFMSMMGIAYLNEIANKKNINEASQILELLRDNVIEALHQEGKSLESKDGMDMSLIIFDINEQKIQYAGANNAMYIIRNDELIMYEPDRMPIGIYFRGRKSPFTNHQIDIHQGDMVYLFTDGFADQFSSNTMNKYKYPRFRKFLQKIHKEPVEKQRELLFEEFENWRGGNYQLDDVLIIGLRF